MPESNFSHTAPGAFIPGVTEQIGFYVYLLIDPRNDEIFYIGKGAGNRCFAHLTEAQTTQADAIGDYEKLARIRDIYTSGDRVRVELLRHSLSEPEALIVESAAIDLLGLPDLTNRVVDHGAAALGRMPAAEVNARYGASPIEIDPRHRVILIRINRTYYPGMSPEALYEATRKWWKIGTWAREIESDHAPDWAFAVYHRIVRAVYRIEGWERPGPQDIAADPNRVSRWGFIGTRDTTMENIYLYTDVSRHLNGQSSRQYVNCRT